MVYHVDSHVASCSMEIHMVNHEVGMRCIYMSAERPVWGSSGLVWPPRQAKIDEKRNPMSYINHS